MIPEKALLIFRIFISFYSWNMYQGPMVMAKGGEGGESNWGGGAESGQL